MNTLPFTLKSTAPLKAKEPGADAFIRISSLQKGNLLILKVENSFDGRLVLKAKEEFPVGLCISGSAPDGFQFRTESSTLLLKYLSHAREAKHAEYERLAEEAALKRRLMEQEADERYYKDSVTKKAVSIAAYEAAGILK